MMRNYNIERFYSVAFAPNGAHFFAFKNKNGGMQWAFWQVNDKAPLFKGKRDCECWTPASAPCISSQKSQIPPRWMLLSLNTATVAHDD